MPLRGGAGSSPFCYRGRGSSSLRCYRWGGLIRQNEGRNEGRAENCSRRPYFKVRRGGKLPSTRESGARLSCCSSTFCTCLFNRAVRGSVSRVLPKANMDWQSVEEGAFVPNHLFERAFSIRNCSRQRRGAGAHARLFHTHRGRTKTVKPFSPPPVPPPPPRWTPTKQNKSGER